MLTSVVDAGAPLDLLGTPRAAVAFRTLAQELESEASALDARIESLNRQCRALLSYIDELRTPLQNTTS